MKRGFIVAAAALLLAGCGSDEDVWNDMFDDPGEFTAATRVSTSATSIEIPTFTLESEDPAAEAAEETPDSTSAAGDTSAAEQAASEDEEPLNEWGLHDQYFKDSYTYKFNEILAKKNFTCEVTYYFPTSSGGETVKQYTETNVINGKDRHLVTWNENGSNTKYYDKEIYYVKDTTGQYRAYTLDWSESSYSLYKDPQFLSDVENSGDNIPSALFYGIDDLETAVYYGYMNYPADGTTLEQFMMENNVYSFTYDSDGILRSVKVGSRSAEILSFEASAPPVKIPSDFKYKE